MPASGPVQSAFQSNVASSSSMSAVTMTGTFVYDTGGAKEEEFVLDTGTAIDVVGEEVKGK